MKSLLDFAPAIAFFVAYMRYDIYVATAVVIVALFAVVAAYGIIERRLHKMHAVAAVAAAVFGGLTLWVRDPEFIKMKPSAVYALFGLVLLSSHFLGQKVLMQRIPQKMLVMPDTVWRRVNLAWAGFFLLLSATNLYVATQLSEATWVHFRTYGFSVMTFTFMLGNLPFLLRYMPREDKTEPPESTEPHEPSKPSE
jgi:intracellular septation protein